MTPRVRFAIGLMVLGVISFLLSVIVGGLDSQLQETSAQVDYAPGWAQWWNYSSIAVAVVGLVMLIILLVRRPRCV